ncbi:MAG: Gfo/Idh/MocA family oxidoreductase, partial [Cytophagales bacterium]|nr:Gfo/Idh/MocA family oxidoreductase [Cytophagales bacterium]
MKSNRREFINRAASGLVGLGALSILPMSVLAGQRRVAPSDRINVALIGCRSHGFNILKHHMDQPDALCVALGDVDQSVLEGRRKDVSEKQGKTPKTYTDYRKLLENKDIDAVIIGTPDHWHCLPMVEALQAGKDVYVEKPMANSIAEVELMTRAALASKQVVQVGQQQRSGTHWAQIMQTIDEGRLGYLRKIQVWGNFAYGVGQARVPDSPAPSTVDFDFWLGPAPKRSFNAARFHGSWRMFWDYGGGLMTDWGVHLLDMALWAKKVDYMPLSVSAVGGNLSFADRAHETPDTLSVVYQMKDFVLTWDHVAGIQSGPYDKLYGIAFVGDQGSLVIRSTASWNLFCWIRICASEIFASSVFFVRLAGRR